MEHPNKQSGFTLIEVLITAFIFSIIVMVVAGIFTDLLNVQRRAIAVQKIQENGLYIMELMSREIRVSTIQDQNSPTCSLTSLTITHPVNGTVTYSLTAGGVLQRSVGATLTDLTTTGIKFSRLNFCVLGSGPTDDQQARVTIVAGVQNATGKEIFTANLQTTVSSRNVQSEFEQ